MAQKTQRRFWSTVEQFENEASVDALKKDIPAEKVIFLLKHCYLIGM